MALPTASTYGYGYYYTVGPTPNVACNCLREWLTVFRRLLRFKGWGDVDVWQCTGDLGSSGGTHSQGGAFDYSGISFNKAMLAREMGAYATWPRNWSGNQHTHGVLSGCPHNDPAAYQLVAMRVYRCNGLGLNGLQGPDPLPKPSLYRTWREGVDWANAQMGQTSTASTTTGDWFDMADKADLEELFAKWCTVTLPPAARASLDTEQVNWGVGDVIGQILAYRIGESYKNSLGIGKAIEGLTVKLPPTTRASLGVGDRVTWTIGELFGQLLAYRISETYNRGIE